ncbi:hypothetical protein CQA66_01705 [Helicobacter aurati]|uniref:HdrB-like C-terminal domain-containing protein n=1 Tax=Helicobacter aurati TaxID=137778 RepID=A0A3D8J960_9HELI|nr:hypothetical protein [Helicobacter aurati]RDU73404.1 hypothetical protein CQA66_01705 [Helicobacter aurati]
MYLLYDCFTHPSSFAVASRAVLEQLNISQQVLNSNEKFKYHGGYYGRIGKIEQFVFANIYNIWLAAKRNCILLALEEDSYANIICAISFVYNNEAIRDFLVKEMKIQNIDIDISMLHKYVAYFPTMVAEYMQDIEQHIKLRFMSNGGFADNTALKNIYSVSRSSAMPLILPKQDIGNGHTGFSTCLYYSNRHFDCNLNGEYQGLSRTFAQIGLQAFEMPFSMQSYTHLLPFNENMAYQKSGEILYAGIDLGVDFLCVFSNSSLNIFDKHFKLCSKYCKRDRIEIPILHLAQLLLLCFDKPKEAAFDLHAIKPSFILDNVKAS